MNESHIQNTSTCDRYITSAAVDDIREEIRGRKTKVMFVVSVCWSDGSAYDVLKCYKEFFDLQCSILDRFPVEGGQYNKDRIIPYLPGRKIFRKNDIRLAQERKPDLDSYIKELIKLKPLISQSKLILDFFENRKIVPVMQPVTDGDVKHFCEENTSTTRTGKTPEGSSDTLCYVNTSYNSDGEEENTENV